MSEELRHHCRRCRIKLSAPVGNPLDAFCCRGCFRLHFDGKCLICDGKKSGKGMACSLPKCRAEYAAKRRYSTRGKYLETGVWGHGSGERQDALPEPIKIGVCGADKGPPRWRQIAGSKLTEAELRLATVPDGRNGTWADSAYLRAENANRARLAEAERRAIEANGYFEDREWREVISADGVRCFR
jgi:hypothetical protein